VKQAIVLVAVLLAGCAGAPAGRSGVSEEAVSQQAATNAAQNRAKVHTDLGSAYLEKGVLSIAQEEARIAVTADPTYAPAYGLMGLVYMALSENAAAEDNFRKALSLAPGDPEISNNYGIFLCQTDREKQSIEYFQVALRNRLYKTPVKPLTAMGICYLKMKDDQQAEGYLFRAVQLDHGNLRALYWLSDIYYRHGRYDEARMSLADLNKVSEPTSMSLWLALRVERKLGDREAEARFASQLRRKFQGSPEYRLLMEGKFD
jgi:type IV pilus assembly protein PilF